MVWRESHSRTVSSIDLQARPLSLSSTNLKSICRDPYDSQGSNTHFPT